MDAEIDLPVERGEYVRISVNLVFFLFFQNCRLLRPSHLLMAMALFALFLPFTAMALPDISNSTKDKIQQAYDLLGQTRHFGMINENNNISKRSDVTATISATVKRHSDMVEYRESRYVRDYLNQQAMSTMTSKPNHTTGEIDFQWELIPQEIDALKSPEFTVSGDDKSDSYFFKRHGQVSTALGYMHLEIPFTIEPFANEALAICECQEVISKEIDKNETRLAILRDEQIQLLPIFEHRCNMARGTIETLVGMFNLTYSNYTDARSPFKKWFLEFHEKNKDKRRGKRAIPAVAVGAVMGIAGGFAGYGLTSLFGVDTSELVHQLKIQELDIQNVAKVQILYSKLMNMLDEEIDNNSKDTRDLVFMKKVDLCHIQSNAVLSKQHQITAALYQLYNNQVPMQLINANLFEATLPKLKAMLQKRKLRTVIDKIGDLYKLKASFIAVNEIIKMIIHVPISPIREMELYELVSAPFITGNGTFTYQVNEPFLAVAPGTTVFTTLPDLSSCHLSFSRGYVCDSQNVFNTNASSSCIMALYKSNEEDIKALCSLERYAPSSYARQLNKNDFVLWTAMDTVAEVECTQHRESSDRITNNYASNQKKDLKTGVHIISVPNACSLEVSGFIMNSEDIRVNASYISGKTARKASAMMADEFARNEALDISKWDLPQWSYPRLTMEHKRVKALIAEIGRQTKQNLELIKKHRAQPLSGLSWFHPFHIGIYSIVLTVLGVIFVGIYFKCKHDRLASLPLIVNQFADTKPNKPKTIPIWKRIDYKESAWYTCLASCCPMKDDSNALPIDSPNIGLNNLYSEPDENDRVPPYRASMAGAHRANMDVASATLSI